MFMQIKDDTLAIHVIYRHICVDKELLTLLKDEIVFLWCYCARENDDKLGKKSIQIKQNLLDTFEELEKV